MERNRGISKPLNPKLFTPLCCLGWFFLVPTRCVGILFGCASVLSLDAGASLLRFHAAPGNEKTSLRCLPSKQVGWVGAIAKTQQFYAKSWVYQPSLQLRTSLTNKVRLCERSEPQSEPVVGRARWWKAGFIIRKLLFGCRGSL
jgi:hypothetical protein